MKKAVIVILAVAILGVIAATQAKQPPATPAPLASGTTSESSNANPSAGQATAPVSYMDGTYTGNAADTPYGPVQIAAVISNGRISDITFLKMPDGEKHSQEITGYSSPYLRQTAIDKQAAKNIEFVSGATATSYGFQESLQAALNQASNS
jgi:uncharacterized protein with FMN-binding domain